MKRMTLTYNSHIWFAVQDSVLYPVEVGSFVSTVALCLSGAAMQFHYINVPGSALEPNGDSLNGTYSNLIYRSG
jgi:hypothetical protein